MYIYIYYIYIYIIYIYYKINEVNQRKSLDENYK